jgi:hypothetical protein
MSKYPTPHLVARNVLMLDEERHLIISTVLTTFSYEVATFTVYLDDEGQEVASPDWHEVEGFVARSEALARHDAQVKRMMPVRCPDCDGAGGWSGQDMHGQDADADCQLCDGQGWLHQHELDTALERRELERLTDDYIPF